MPCGESYVRAATPNVLPPRHIQFGIHLGVRRGSNSATSNDPRNVLAVICKRSTLQDCPGCRLDSHSCLVRTQLAMASITLCGAMVGTILVSL